MIRIPQTLLILVSLSCVGCREERRGDKEVQKEGVWGYHVASRIRDSDARGGFGLWENYSRPCSNETPGKVGTISLIALPEQILGRRDCDHLRLLLVNRSGKTATFAACDSALYIALEAQDKDGKWQRIESWPETSCGNSYHRVFLPQNEYWAMTAPRSSGRFETVLRFQLVMNRPEENVGNGPIYSNEFDGSIDPVLLERVQER